MLYIANIASISATSFYAAAVRAAHDAQIDFHLALNCPDRTKDRIALLQKEMGLTFHQIDFIRNPFDIRNIKAYRQMVATIKKERFDIIHCNTPIGGVIGRLVAKQCGVKKVIYQAHGFHFFKGAPLQNWLFYYPVERWLARYTDALLTINQEDCERSKRFALRGAGEAYHVSGVGIDVFSFQNAATDPKAVRESLGVAEDEILLISMGDLVKRKNYETALYSVYLAKNKKIKYCICGEGPQLSALQKRSADLGIGNQVLFLGCRSDVRALLCGADIFLFTTKQEGLPRSLMEAMASGLPCVASKVRGNTDLMDDGAGGYLFGPRDAQGFAKGIQLLAGDQSMRERMGALNRKTIQGYNLMAVSKQISAVYAMLQACP